MKHLLSATGRVVGALAVCALVVVVASWGIRSADSAAPAGSGARLTGYAWSETIGHISFDDAGAYVNVNEDGDLIGYAWSENVGWVKFGGLSGFPSTAAGGNARLQGDELLGWARVCSGTSQGNCGGSSRNDGWDGWISLQGFTGPYSSGSVGSGTAGKPATSLTNGSAGPSHSGNVSSADYGIRLVGDDQFIGFAWGAANVGWVDFSHVGLENYFTCTTPEGVVLASGSTHVVTGARNPATNLCPVKNYSCSDTGDLSRVDTTITCTADVAIPCTRGTKTLEEGESATFYAKPLVSEASMCDGANLTCIAGVLVGPDGVTPDTTHMHSRCSVVPGITEF